MLKKRAQGLSIRVIIMAVISLIILIVLITIFSGRLSIFANTVGDSQSCSEICQLRDYSGGKSSPAALHVVLPGGTDSDGNQCYCAT